MADKSFASVICAEIVAELLPFEMVRDTVCGTAIGVVAVLLSVAEVRAVALTPVVAAISLIEAAISSAVSPAPIGTT